MAELDQDVHAVALAWVRAGASAAIATVIETWGSSPRPRGSQLAVRSDGLFVGSVSGGCVEGKVVEAAQRIVGTGVPELLEFGVSQQTAWDVGLACGGTVRIRVEPVAKGGAALLEAVAAARARGVALVLLTPLEDGEVRAWMPGDELSDELRQAAERALANDDAFTVATAAGRVFVQPLNPPLRLVIVGAVHIAQPLAVIGNELGYAVTIVDPRAAFARAERWPAHAKVVHAWPDEAFADAPPDARTAIVALTHDPKIDDPALQIALSSPAFYVGALGSRKTHASRCERLTAAGFDAEAIARIHGPVGLPIAARSPGEIAVSIAAEMTETLRRGVRRRVRSRVAAVVLGAGASRRMGGVNKLLEKVDGVPVIARVVDALAEATPEPVIVVLGHQAAEVREALGARRVRFVDNPAHAEGMGSSIRAGVRAVGGDVDAVLLCLGDLPRLSPVTARALVDAFDPGAARSICVPVHEGRRGHPVLWSTRHVPELAALEGDLGARSVLERHLDAVLAVPVDDPGILLDVDTPEALAQARAAR